MEQAFGKALVKEPYLCCNGKQGSFARSDIWTVEPGRHRIGRVTAG